MPANDGRQVQDACGDCLGCLDQSKRRHLAGANCVVEEGVIAAMASTTRTPHASNGTCARTSSDASVLNGRLRRRSTRSATLAIFTSWTTGGLLGNLHERQIAAGRTGEDFRAGVRDREEVVAALLRFASAENLTGGHLTAIGAFQQVTLGFFDPAKKEYTPIFIEEQVELLSFVANIARDDAGMATLHAHVVVGKSDGSAHGGHLLEALVRPTMETIVVESSQHLRRRMRNDVGAALLDLSS